MLASNDNIPLVVLPHSVLTCAVYYLSDNVPKHELINQDILKRRRVTVGTVHFMA